MRAAQLDQDRLAKLLHAVAEDIENDKIAVDAWDEAISARPEEPVAFSLDIDTMLFKESKTTDVLRNE